MDVITQTAVLESLYKVFLLRNPKGPEIQAWLGVLSTGEMTIDQVMKQIIKSREFRSKYPAFTRSYRLNTDRDDTFISDHSQFGEITLLLKWIVDRYAMHKIVVDVGTYGREYSNSYDFLKCFGWRGLLIEANPGLVDGIRDEFSGLNFELVNCAISDYEGYGTLHLGVRDGLSSLAPDRVLHKGENRGDVDCKICRLAPLLQFYNIPPDFTLLSIDAEGEDIKILNDLIANSIYRPELVIIEASYNYSIRSLLDLDFCKEAREQYNIVDQTKANLILAKVRGSNPFFNKMASSAHTFTIA